MILTQLTGRLLPPVRSGLRCGVTELQARRVYPVRRSKPSNGSVLSKSALATTKGHDYLVDGQVVARDHFEILDRAVALGAQHVFHLHRVDDAEFLAGFNLIALLHREAKLVSSALEPGFEAGAYCTKPAG